MESHRRKNMTNAANFIDFTSGNYDLPFEVVFRKNFKTLGKFDTRAEADAFIANGKYILLTEDRANEGLPCTAYGEYVPANEQDFWILTVKHSDKEQNLTVNEKVQALLAKKGKPARSSSENKFRQALEQLVADWQAESLEACTNPRYADFVDTKVAKSINIKFVRQASIYLTFDGSGYDYLSASAGYPIESYRNALQALCDLHGWDFEDATSWAIAFYRN